MENTAKVQESDGKVRVVVWMDAELHRAAVAQAERDERSLSAYVRWLLRGALEGIVVVPSLHRELTGGLRNPGGETREQNYPAPAWPGTAPGHESLLPQAYPEMTRTEDEPGKMIPVPEKESLVGALRDGLRESLRVVEEASEPQPVRPDPEKLAAVASAVPGVEVGLEHASRPVLPEPLRAACEHPARFRLGTRCQACGAKVAALGTIGA